MKKQRLPLLLLLVIPLLFLLKTQQVQAVSFDINRYDITIDILNDGSANVSRTLTYNFEGEAHGVLYQQAVRNSNQLLSDPEVLINNQPATQANTGANNTYTLNRTQNLYRFKVYHPVEDDTLTVTYKYHLNQVVKNYADIAELNWKIVGSNWEDDLNQVKITINLPARNIDSLQAWSHGSLDGYTKVDKKAGQVILTLDTNPAGRFIESHLIFDPKITPLNSYTSPRKMKRQIQKQEALLTKQANEKRQRQKRVYRIFAIIFMGLGIITGLSALLVTSQKPKNTHYPYTLKKAPHIFELPEIPVAQAQALCFLKKPDSAAFSAHLLELEAKGSIKIEPLSTKLGRFNKKPDYRISLIDTKLMQSPEEKLLQFLFKLHSTPYFSLKELKNLSNKKKKKVTDLFKSWCQTNFTNTGISKYQGWHHPAVSLFFAWIITFVLFFIATFFAPEWIAIMGVFLVFTGIASFYLYKTRSPYKIETVTKINHIRGFYSMLNDIGRFNLRELDERILWADIMPLALAFGLAPKVSKVLYANFTDEELTQQLGIYYPLFYHNEFAFETSFDDSFTHVIYSPSSTNGSSGGFSGGSSGGFGGGSGGGAF